MPKTNTKKPPFIPPAAADDLVISRKQHGRKVSRETCQRVFEILRRIGLYGNQQFLPRVSALDGNELFRFLSAEVARQNNGEQTGAEGLKKISPSF